jgi:hypothetical protein
MAQINQTRDNLKTEYQSINIVQWKNSTDLKRLTSVERGGECVFWNSDLMKQIVMCKDYWIGRDILKMDIIS